MDCQLKTPHGAGWVAVSLKRQGSVQDFFTVWHLPAVTILMDGFIPPVTLEESKIFQKIDRELYTILVEDLSLNPTESMQVMGLWLWFERFGYKNAISKILSQPVLVIDELAAEAKACLKCLDGIQYPLLYEGTEIPVTRNILQNDVSLKYFHINGHTVCKEIQTLIARVYVPVLSDIMEKASLKKIRMLMEDLSQMSMEDPSQMSMQDLSQMSVHGFSEMSIQDSRQMSMLGSRQMSMQVHAASSSNPMLVQPAYGNPSVQIFSNNNIYAGTSHSPSNVAPANESSFFERTMFATFSKGYPLSESEIRRFFAKVYGNCIESVHMQEVRADEQALYARVVFRSPAFIDDILNGLTKAKFSIDGKHIWMRKFVPNSGRH